jgi:ribonuclease BN (tRNA processing enzyme)
LEPLLTICPQPNEIFSKELSPRPSARDFAQPHDVVAPGLIYDDGSVRVTAAENTHYQDFNAGADKSFAYRFDTPDRSVVFTGDTGPSEAVTQLAIGADILVSEVVDVDAVTTLANAQDNGGNADPNSPLAAHMQREHLSPEAVGKMAQAAHVKMVVLSHIAPGSDDEHDMTRYSAGVKRYFSGPVIVGRDLDEF